MHHFTEFVREHQDMVYSTAMRIVADPHEAEDIAQRVFVQAWSRFEELQGHENPGGWLRLTARNLSINHVRRHSKRRHLRGTAEELPRDDNEGTDDHEWLYAQADLIKSALARLPGRLRAPLVLFYYEDMDYESIAAALRCSIGKVKPDVFRARAGRKEILTRMEHRDDRR